jgi:hypothetical protein
MMPSAQTLRVRAVLEEQVTPAFKGLSDVVALRQLWEVLAARATVPDEVVGGLAAKVVSVNEYEIAVADIPSPITTG